MSKWTHAICDVCWNYEFPERDEPVRLHDPEGEHCCFCGLPTESGIYVRHDPKDPRLFCNGGEDHAD